MEKNIYIKTFGCQMNQYDSDRIFDSLKNIGYKKTNLILTVSILDHIDPGMDKDLFVKDLQNKIYFELDKLG